MVAETARSRFTFELCAKLPKLVRRRVSGETPTLNSVDVKDVIVRHVPLILMLSPRWASVRISSQSEMVREVPPPPDEVSSWDSRAVTAG